MTHKPLFPVRPLKGRILAGVCSGIGEHFVLDVTLVRLAFLIFAMAWGFGALVYGLLWVLMPDPERLSSERTFKRTARGMRVDIGHSVESLSEGWRRLEHRPWPRPFGRRWLAIGLMLAGLFIVLASLGAFEWLNAARAFGLAMIAMGAAAMMTMKGRG